MVEEILAAYGYFGVFGLALAMNLIPFASPSNMLLAGAISALLPFMNPTAVGIIVALAATLAKGAHFYIGSMVGSRASGKAGERLRRYGLRLGKWGALGAFLAAASPIPDDPVVIPLGLVRYSLTKFFAAYLLGKLTITLVGAHTVRYASITMEALTGGGYQAAAGITLLLFITSILFKVGAESILEHTRVYLKRLGSRFRRDRTMSLSWRNL